MLLVAEVLLLLPSPEALVTLAVVSVLAPPAFFDGVSEQ